MKKDIDMAEKVSGVSSAPMSKLGVQIAGGEDFSHGGGGGRGAFQPRPAAEIMLKVEPGLPDRWRKIGSSQIRRGRCQK